MESLPPELIHHIVFSFTISAQDVLSLALTSHHLHNTILGPIDSPNALDSAKHRAKTGIVTCATRNWPLALSIALDKGYGQSVVVAGDYLLQTAAENGLDEIVSVLLSHGGVDPGSYRNTVIGTACEYGQTAVVRILLDDPRVDPASMENYPLRIACQSGHLDTVNLLLQDDRVDPSAKDNFALHWAAKNGHIEIVQLLLADPRISPFESNNNVFVTAARAAQVDILLLLVQDPRFDPSILADFDIDPNSL